MEKNISKSAVLVVVSVVQFIVPYMLSSLVIALPAIGKEFSAGAMHLSLIEMVYMLGLAVFLLPAGRFADIYGHKKVFISGIAVTILSTFALALSVNIETLILLRFAQGLGGALITATSLTILSFVFPPEERGKAMGIVVSCVFIGLSAGPTLSGLMVSFLGWRYIFFLAVPVQIAALVLAIMKLKSEWINEKEGQFDLIGSLIYMGALLSLIVGVTHLNESGFAKWLAVPGGLGFVWFFVYEYKKESPLLNVALIYTNRPFTFNSLATLINYAASFGVMFFFSIYLQAIKGFSPKTTGLILIIQPVIQAVLAPVAGRLSDKYPPTNIAAIGMGLCTVGLMVTVFLTQTTSIEMVILIQVFLGSGFSFFASPNLTAIMGSVEPVHYGLASGFVSTMRYIGMMISLTIITVMLSFFLGNQPVSTVTSAAFINSMKMTLIIFSIMNFSGIFLTIGTTTFGKQYQFNS